MKRIGIIGTRRRDSLEDFAQVLKCFMKVYQPGDVIVSGGCKKGGDRFAEIIAEVLRVDPVLHAPDESAIDGVLLSKNPRAAWAQVNYARNTIVANDVDVVIACVAPDRTGGTEDTLKKFCKRFGISPRCPSGDPNNDGRVYLV